jgi:hypothetical protein
MIMLEIILIYKFCIIFSKKRETSFEFNFINVFVLLGAIFVLLAIWVGVFGISIQLEIQNKYVTWKEIKIQG